MFAGSRRISAALRTTKAICAPHRRYQSTYTQYYNGTSYVGPCRDSFRAQKL